MNRVLASIRRQVAYDPATGVFTWKVQKSGVSRTKKQAGTRCNGYRTIMVDGVRYYGAVLAWFMMKGRLPSREVDHKNRIGSDDRWKNLRLATHLQNSRNRGVYSNNKAKIRGVRRRRNGKWESRICVNKKPLYLGVFDSAEDASLCYEKAAKKYFGHFAPQQEIP